MNLSRHKHVVSSLAAAGLLLVGLFLLLDAPSQTALAAGTHLFVTSGGSGDCSQENPCDLQTAFGTATDGDTIFLAAGTYTGSGGAVITVTHSITLCGGWDGASTGVVERDPDVYASILDGERARRVVYIGEGITPTLDGLIISRGNATGLTCAAEYQPAGCGGGIFAYNAHPLIANNVITNNVAASTAAAPTRTIGYGGGVYLANVDHAVISRNVIISNAASTSYCGFGGGLRLRGTAAGVRVEANQVLSNVATTTGQNAWGGGIAGGPDGALIQGNHVEGNRANSTGGGHGAGLYQFSGSAEYQGNIVRGNQGEDAVFLGQSHSRFERNQVADNPSRTGIYLWDGFFAGGELTLVNNVVTRNGQRSLSAFTTMTHPLTAKLLHNTLVGAGTGDGVHIESGNITLFLTNTIVASHTWAITNAYPASSTVVADHTLFWDNTNDGIRGVNPVDGAPRFVNPDGGDYHLDSGSAAIDAGVNAGVTTDKDGTPRPQRTAPDIGAYEFEGLLLVVDIVGQGIVTQDPAQVGYHYGDVVTLTATADLGWTFAGWGGDVTGTNEVVTHTIEGDTVVTATFEAIPYILDVNIFGDGTVDVAPDQETYIYGGLITLTATADLGWTFAGWSGDVTGTNEVVTHTIEGDTVVTATLTQDEYSLDVNIVGEGTVSKEPDQAFYYYGDVVTLSLAADRGWTFDAWSGPDASDLPENSDGSWDLVMDDDKTVTATFTQDEYTIHLPLIVR